MRVGHDIGNLAPSPVGPVCTRNTLTEGRIDHLDDLHRLPPMRRRQADDVGKCLLP